MPIENDENAKLKASRIGNLGSIERNGTSMFYPILQKEIVFKKK